VQRVLLPGALPFAPPVTAVFRENFNLGRHSNKRGVGKFGKTKKVRF